VLNEEFLKIACEELGCGVETIKKEAAIAQSTRPEGDQV